ncbi:thioredoxin family protein [Planococcus salinarum]|uniref:thioredoxin family protein n=1 Tax=Planococcus salinarum TaxID=622695 RepID=UPI000E3E6D9F|nr:thioredoxin family protein [Planococcus salinarum]TAA71781.1 thioredoxin family protein [Planococcus salinarum]
MTLEQNYFENAITLEKYMSQMESNQDKSYSIYEKFSLPEDKEFFNLLKEKNPHILVITEDWCGDAMMNNAILRKITDAGDVEVRCVYRDENPELMDSFPADEGRSIPKYIFLSQDGEPLGAWGPRSAKVQQFVDDLKAKLPEEEDPQYDLHFKTVLGEITDGFVYRSEFWDSVYGELKAALTKSLS